MAVKKNQGISAIDKFKANKKKERSTATAKFVMRKLSKDSKAQKVLEIRRDGKLLAWVKANTLKGEGLNKEQAVKRYITTGSFRKDVLERTKFSNGFTQTISQKQFGSLKRSQIGADIFIKSKGKVHTFRGYSDLNGTNVNGVLMVNDKNNGRMTAQDQAKRRALIGASNSGIINYKDIPKLMNDIKAKYFYINFSFLSEEKERAFA